MKRVTLLVPDTIRFSLGSSRSNKTREVPVSGKSITDALEVVDYHERYSFAAGSVFVVGIEDFDDSPLAPDREEPPKPTHIDLRETPSPPPLILE